MFLVASHFKNWYSGAFFCVRQQQFLWRCNIYGAVTATTHMVSCHFLTIVCFKKSKPVDKYLLSKDERAKCSWTILLLPLLKRSFSRWGLAFMQAWRKCVAAIWKNSFGSVLEELCSTILSTVAARSKLGQGVSRFCPEVMLGGDSHSAFFLFGQLQHGWIARGWEKGSNVDAWKAEF